VALIVLVVLVTAGFIASRIDTGKFAISPGGAQPVAPLITIDGHTGKAVGGKIMLTDVLLTPLSWLTYLPAKLDSSNDIVPASALVPSGVSVSELDAQGYLEMDQSKYAAKTAALTRLGYKVGAAPDGAVVTAVGEHAPATGQVSVADVITAVNGSAVSTACGVISDVHSLVAGSRVALTVRVATIHPDGTITNGTPQVKNVTLGEPPDDRPAPSCPGVTGPSKGYLGVSLDNDIRYSFPIPISISTDNIGGPSAGLAMTLGIIDQLSGGNLVHHRVLAATGTIDPGGQVGDVGGVPQKTIAVSRAGATLFLVPVEELSAARSKATSTLRIKAVSTLDQALNALMRLGGTITMANGTTESLTSKVPGP